MDVVCNNVINAATGTEAAKNVSIEARTKQFGTCRGVHGMTKSNKKRKAFVRLRQVPVLQNITRVTKDSPHVTLSRSTRIAPSFSAPSQSERTSLAATPPRTSSVLPNKIPSGNHKDIHSNITLKSSRPQLAGINGVSPQRAEVPINATPLEMRKRARELTDMKLDDYQVVEIDRRSLSAQEAHQNHFFTSTSVNTNSHKKQRYLLNLPDPHVASNPVQNNERRNRLDPCPVISQLGRAEIGNQLHVAQDWESRPGCCDPRVTKLCRTTTENSIKNYLLCGMATIGAKVFYVDGQNKTKAEGWITNDGILCSRCGFVLGCREFRTCAGLKSLQNGCRLLLSTGIPLKAQTCKFQKA